ncbi:hypothetical protein GYK49_14900, partial [Lactobacillus paracasei]|nr:hypothetical protein [Lacticaseibacillus paracasei]
VKELGQLYDYYLATNGTMLDANGYSQAYSFFGLSTSNTDYAAAVSYTHLTLPTIRLV